MQLETIYGPPGTGKTQELAKLAAAARGPVTFLSYTRAAALEAAGRVQNDVNCSTIHSLAFRALGLDRQAVVTPKKLAELGTVAGVPFKGMDGAEDEQEGDEYLAVISYARNRLMPEGEAYDRFGRPGSPARFNMFTQAYEQWKDTFGYLDFDDMLTQATKLDFASTPTVILDEAQDCSQLQWLAFTEIAAGAKQVYIAGDDDQAIYEWSGADPHAMMKMAGKTRTLKKSWRLPREIFKLAVDSTISQIKQRVRKVWSPADDKRAGLIGHWGEFGDVAIDWRRNILVLCRDNYRLRELQRILHEKSLPYAMATKNSPYENRYARAIRGWTRDDEPTDDERAAMSALVQSDIVKSMIVDKDWARLRKLNWREHLNVPERMLDFYEHADLSATLHVKLSTIHQAKGTEADVVVLDLTLTPRVERGIDLDRDAELRVMYVGLTRARHELHLVGENRLIQ